jgi:hypothetical protein
VTKDPGEVKKLVDEIEGREVDGEKNVAGPDGKPTAVANAGPDGKPTAVANAGPDGKPTAVANAGHAEFKAKDKLEEKSARHEASAILSRSLDQAADKKSIQIIEHTTDPTEIEHEETKIESHSKDPHETKDYLNHLEIHIEEAVGEKASTKLIKETSGHPEVEHDLNKLEDETKPSKIKAD